MCGHEMTRHTVSVIFFRFLTVVDYVVGIVFLFVSVDWLYWMSVVVFAFNLRLN